MAEKRSKEAILAERRENTARQTEMLESQGFHAENATISITKATIMSFVTAIPLAVVFIVIFHLCHRDTSIEMFAGTRSSLGSTVFCIAYLLSIPVHELLHGLGWVGFTKLKWKSIQFGVMWDSFTPYCHCRESLTVVQYYVGLIMPCFVLGVIPCIISIFIGFSPLLLLGAVNIFMAGGDTTIGWIILKYLGKNVRILDHPTECGAVAFVR